MVFPQNHFFLTAFLSIAFLSFLLAVYIACAKNKRESSFKANFEDLQGRTNIAYQQLEVEEERSRSLRVKLKRYDVLAALTERLNQNLSLNDTIDMLLDETALLFSQGSNVCRVYLIDNGSNSLSLGGARGTGGIENTMLKENHPDLFDDWVLRHLQPLLIEDASNDFRFDARKLNQASGAKIGSLISCCLMSHNRPIGILRLDSPWADLFNLEDLRLLSTIADIAGVAIDNALYYQHSKELAVRDSLTDLYTRKFSLENLADEIKRCLITGSGLAVMMLDIDFFKKYNDQYGHLAGDVVLKTLGRWLQDFFKGKPATVSRYGGEEFMVTLAIPTKQDAFIVAEEIRSAIQEKRIILRRKITGITVSIGIAHLPTDAIARDELLQKADMALYEAKRLGRNRVCLY